MTDKQDELLEQLVEIFSKLADECDNDKKFNKKISKIIQENNITQYNFNDLVVLLSGYTEHIIED